MKTCELWIDECICYYAVTNIPSYKLRTIRIWCHKTFGTDNSLLFGGRWQISSFGRQLYFKTETDRNWFLLRWLC